METGHADIELKLKKLERLLINTPLEKYSEKVCDIFRAVACGNVDPCKIRESERQCLAENLKKAKQLLAMLRNEPVKAGRVAIDSDKALKAMTDVLVEEYKEMGWNYKEMTFDEAEAKLKNWSNDQDTAKWIEETLYEYYSEMGLCWKGSCHLSKYDLDDFPTEPANVEYYIEENPIEEEVNADQVERQILFYSSNKKGRKRKNEKLQWAITQIRRFYPNHSNKDCRLFFECADLFGMIDEDVKKQWHWKNNKDLGLAKTSYIKSVYKQALKFHPDAGGWNKI